MDGIGVRPPKYYAIPGNVNEVDRLDHNQHSLPPNNIMAMGGLFNNMCASILPEKKGDGLLWEVN
jgi:hypothetical protein